MTYDQWKTTDPADFFAPICEVCGSYVRGFLGNYECDDCADERAAEEAMIKFFRWEPESQADEHDGAVAKPSSAERVATLESNCGSPIGSREKRGRSGAQ